MYLIVAIDYLTKQSKVKVYFMAKIKQIAEFLYKEIIT